MAAESCSKHPDEFYSPWWNYEANRPVVDGKYNDPKTGEILVSDGAEWQGPPAVDIVIMSVHEETTGCVYRAQRAFPVEKLLYYIVCVINEHKLRIDSIHATAYAIRVILAHELSKDEFSEISSKMANGIWDR